MVVLLGNFFAAPLSLCEHRRVQSVELFIIELFDSGVAVTRQDVSPWLYHFRRITCTNADLADAKAQCDEGRGQNNSISSGSTRASWRGK